MNDKQDVTVQTGQTSSASAGGQPSDAAASERPLQQGQGGQPVQQGSQAVQQQNKRRDGRSMVPRVDVLEDEAGITLLADLPGVPKDGLELKVEGDTLLIDGEVTTPTPQGLRSVYAEVRIPRYRRAFTLSRELDPGRIEANMKDGVLKLRIPKQEHAKPRRITVGTG